MAEQVAAAAGDIVAAYEAALAERGYRPDPAQRRAVERLQRLCEELCRTERRAPRPVGSPRSTLGFLRRVFAPKEAMPVEPAVRSVYLWGGVGRGKSFVMDVFFAACPFPAKRRVHFHAFMQRVHEDLRRHREVPDPLAKVAEDIAAEVRLLCFDEFHVSDIADAMILGRLLEALLARSVVFVLTSNYPPHGLYPNGLMRINFLPTIALIERTFDVLEVDSGTDYRLRTLENVELYLVPPSPENEAKLREDFRRLTGRDPVPGTFELFGREIPYLGRHQDVIWFSFSALCDGPRSQNDYLEIAREHDTVLLSGIPRMGPAQASQARRFTWLIDVLYDHRVKLIATAEAEPQELYREGLNAHEFVRTASRLIEMRTRDYLAEAHRPA